MVKILGFEINRSEKNAEPLARPVPNLAATQPSKPLKKSYPMVELGDSGTRATKGIIAEEYNPNLVGINAIKIYNEMRLSDGTVRAAMLVTTLPIRRATWFVNPVSEDPKDIEVADFVKRALFDWLDASWDDIVRQALLMLPFGVMAFEKVYGPKQFEGKNYITITKLAPRMPRSIQQWELTDGTFGIRQVRQDGQTVDIPGSKLLLFINEREGDNYWGTSMLRAAYKHWYYKNTFYKIDAVAFERQGLGVPVMKMPQGFTQSDKNKAETALQNLRANESAYLILPPGYEAEFMKMGAGETRDPQNSINHHNKEILQSVLAQFLELGQTSTGGGSRALSSDHSDLFLNAMESIATTIISEVNKNLIPELVDMNFSDVKIYPSLDFSGINRVDVKGLAEGYAALVNAKGITPTDNDEKYLRSVMGLPERTQDEIDEANQEEEDKKTQKEQIDHVDIDDPTDEKPPKPLTPEEIAAQQAIEDQKKKDMQDVKASEKRVFDDGKEFSAWRKLTFTEQKVSFANIEKEMNTLQADFEKDAGALLNEAKDAFVAKLQTALDDGDTKGISDLEIKFVNDYKKLIKNYLKKAYEYGKSNASTEMDVSTPGNSADTLASLDLLADTIAWKAAIDIETKAKTSAVNGLKKLSEKKKKQERFASVIQVVGTIDAILEETVGKTVSAAAGLIINQAINMGRKDVFDKNANKIYALQRSEILDQDTCAFCLSMDGRIVSLDDKWASEDCFHTNCRGIWVEILKEEPELPEIDGVPGNLGDYYGGEPNALIQPNRPIVREDSPAADEVARRAQEKKKNK